MKILVVGTGSIGLRHVANLKSISNAEIFVFDTKKEKKEETASKLRLKALPDLKSAVLQKYDAVLICTPPSLHISLAEKFLGCTKTIFIEKPISDKLKQAELFAKKAAEKKISVLVG